MVRIRGKPMVLLPRVTAARPKHPHYKQSTPGSDALLRGKTMLPTRRTYGLSHTSSSLSTSAADDDDDNNNLTYPGQLPQRAAARRLAVPALPGS